jgi:hypothetical protein
MQTFADRTDQRRVPDCGGNINVVFTDPYNYLQVDTPADGSEGLVLQYSLGIDRMCQEYVSEGYTTTCPESISLPAITYDRPGVWATYPLPPATLPFVADFSGETSEQFDIVSGMFTTFKGLYRAIELGNRNMAIWPVVNSLSPRGTQCAINFLCRPDGVQQNGGIVFNYDDGNYMLVELDERHRVFRVLQVHRGRRIVLDTVAVPQLKPFQPRSLRVQLDPTTATITTVRCSLITDDAPPLRVEIPTERIREQGRFGLHADQAVTWFSSFDVWGI